MIDRFRDALDRPLDRGPAQAIVALATVVTFAFGVLVVLGIVGHDQTSDPPVAGLPLVRPSAPADQTGVPEPVAPSTGGDAAVPSQDPQDRTGTGAYRRARRATDTHRAMQHLPYRIGRVTFALVGADEGRAVIRIAGPSSAVAHRAWGRFLHRFSDDGRAYETRFEAGARNGVTGRPKVAGEGARGAARADGADRRARRRVPHQDRHRAAHRNLTSKPHPKESP